MTGKDLDNLPQLDGLPGERQPVLCAVLDSMVFIGRPASPFLRRPMVLEAVRSEAAWQRYSDRMYRDRLRQLATDGYRWLQMAIDGYRIEG